MHHHYVGYNSEELLVNCGVFSFVNGGPVVILKPKNFNEIRKEFDYIQNDSNSFRMNTTNG